jgi:AcrR family transcriptional regulator
MGIAERKERDREALRTRIVEAARDIVSDEGLDALSMRAIAERIEYSPATIYLHFRDKDELVREVVLAGFERMNEYGEEEFAKLGEEVNPTEQHRAMGRAYARFALENTAYFRVMFELPSVAQAPCPADCEEMRDEGRDARAGQAWESMVSNIQQAIDAGLFRMPSAERAAVISWGLIHGLTSLYLSGHLRRVASHEEFLALIEEAMDTLGVGWKPRETVVQRIA